jgi:3'-phosphoadenosine 5'-phosphosulfate sulfotransferase (PAPS reductase)/FAD synthetase
MTVIDKGLEVIRACLREAPGPLAVAYSGGKDSLAVVFLLVEAGIPFTLFNENSFYFARQSADIKRTVKKNGWPAHFYVSFDDDWLRRHPEYIFTNDSTLKAQTYEARSSLVRKYAVETVGATSILWGRRNQENTVIASTRRDKAGLLHGFPIREWRTEDIWDYLDARMPRPWIYSTPFGYLKGNAPFYSLNRRYMAGSVAECWRLCTALDPTITEERFKA